MASIMGISLGQCYSGLECLKASQEQPADSSSPNPPLTTAHKAARWKRRAGAHRTQVDACDGSAFGSHNMPSPSPISPHTSRSGPARPRRGGGRRARGGRGGDLQNQGAARRRARYQGVAPARSQCSSSFAASRRRPYTVHHSEKGRAAPLLPLLQTARRRLRRRRASGRRRPGWCDSCLVAALLHAHAAGLPANRCFRAASGRILSLGKAQLIDLASPALPRWCRRPRRRLRLKGA